MRQESHKYQYVNRWAPALDQIYTAAGASTADPSSLFERDDTDPIGTYEGATVPQDVATVCQGTDACTSPGSIQPDDQG
jgi:hypothetical protein